MEMEVHSWATAQDIIKKYSQSQALKADLMESAPKSQGHIVNQMSGSGGSAPRPARQSPGEQRKKYDPDNRGRDKTKTHPSHGGGHSPGRSKSNSRVCWTCDEVVTGDHYAANCPKQNKKEEQTRLITPYPGRNRSGSREKGGASQGGETYRMLQGSFGTKPWSKAWERAVAESTASVAGSAALEEDTRPTAAPEAEESEDEEDVEDEEWAKLEEDQMVIDEAVKALIEMELKQRKN